MNILEKIIARKKEEVSFSKSRLTLKDLQETRHFYREISHLKKSLREVSRNGIISEFKRKSPSKGDIALSANLEDVVKFYDGSNVSGISVLTDRDFFGGSNDDLIKAREITELPILRKDFTIDVFQIYEAKSIGADAILLIAAILEKEEMEEFTELAHELGLEVLVEVHSKEELEKIPENADVIGINNRDLKTFTVDLNHSIELLSFLPKEKTCISESGIGTLDDALLLIKAGFNGLLIGESFMKNRELLNSFSSEVLKTRQE